MSNQLLVNVFEITLPGLGSVVQPHGLKVAGVGVTPTQVLCDRASPIAASAMNSTSVSFTNLSSVPATANFRVEYDHSIHATGATPIRWRGFTAPSGIGTAIFGSFSSTVDQFFTAGSPLVVSYTSTDAANGVSLVAGTKLTVAAPGIYAVAVSPQLKHNGGGTEIITFWPRVDGADLPNSASSFEMGNNNNRTLPFIEIILPLNAGQRVEWVFYASTGTNVSLEHFPVDPGPPAIPAIPSVIATVKRLGDIP